MKKMAWMGGMAVACLALTTWSVLCQKPLIAAALTLGGIGLEAALMILMPSRTPVIIPKAHSSEESLDLTQEFVTLKIWSGVTH